MTFRAYFEFIAAIEIGDPEQARARARRLDSGGRLWKLDPEGRSGRNSLR